MTTARCMSERISNITNSFSKISITRKKVSVGW